MLPLKFEVLDGEVADIAGPADISSTSIPAADYRVWVAQGRERVALRATTRERMETRSDFMAFDGVHREQPIAVEYANLSKRLYTLTRDVIEGPNVSQKVRSCLYVENVANPTAPVQIAAISFVDYCWDEPAVECSHLNNLHFPSWDYIQDIKLWEETGEDDLIVVRSDKRLITLVLKTTATGAYFQIRGWAPELFEQGRGEFEQGSPPPTNEPWFHDSSGFAQKFKMHKLTDFCLGRDVNGKLMAYVLAEAGGWDNERPFPEMMIACDLDGGQTSNLNYWYPRFDCDPNPNAYHYQIFNPMVGIPTIAESGVKATLEQKLFNKAHHLDAYASGGSAWLYVACGHNQQVHRLDVSNLFPYQGAMPPPTLGSTKIDVRGGEEFLHVVADPVAPHTRFFTSTNINSYIWNNAGATPTVVTTSHPGATWQLNEPSGLGCPRDAFVMQGLPDPSSPGNPLTVVWAAFHDTVDHVGKVFDLTYPPPLGYVRTVAEFFGINSSDGAVAVGQDVYLPTFGGVAHYALINGKYRFVGNPDSYQPAEYPAGSGEVNITEHIDTGSVPDVSGPDIDVLFTAPAQASGLTTFNLNATTKDPAAATRWNPSNGTFNPALEAAGSCSCSSTNPTCVWCFDCSPVQPSFQCHGADAMYGNDAVFLDMSKYSGAGADNKLVLTDATRWDIDGVQPLRNQITLSAYRWNALPATWNHIATVASPQLPTDVDTSISTSITVAKRPVTGELFAFVGHNSGLAVFDISGLPGSGTTVGNLAYAGQHIPTTSQNAWISAVAVVEDRVFYIENSNPPLLFCYEWVTPNATDPPLAFRTALVLDNVLPPGSQPTHPGGGVRARVRKLPAPSIEYHVYFAGQPYLTQWKWPGQQGPNNLDLMGYWSSEYDGYLQDCRIYEFNFGDGLKPYVLAAKDLESFSIIGPVN